MDNNKKDIFFRKLARLLNEYDCTIQISAETEEDLVDVSFDFVEDGEYDYVCFRDIDCIDSNLISPKINKVS